MQVIQGLSKAMYLPSIPEIKDWFYKLTFRNPIPDRTFHFQRVGDTIEIRNGGRGLLLCSMDVWTWDNCFQTQQARTELFNVILKFYELS